MIFRMDSEVDMVVGAVPKTTLTNTLESTLTSAQWLSAKTSNRGVGNTYLVAQSARKFATVVK